MQIEIALVPRTGTGPVGIGSVEAEVEFAEGQLILRGEGARELRLLLGDAFLVIGFQLVVADVGYHRSRIVESTELMVRIQYAGTFNVPP